MKQNYMYTGFTLAELLAVVIIVAILSSLSLGYYKKSVEQARFAEGLSAASALVEAINQAYLEDRMNGVSETNAKKKRKINTLDFSIPTAAACTSPSDYCIATPHFEIEIFSLDTRYGVKAYRGTPGLHKHTYYIQRDTSFSAEPDRIACVGDNTDGQRFCESMGYTDCDSGTYFCTKP